MSLGLENFNGNHLKMRNQPGWLAAKQRLKYQLAGIEASDFSQRDIHVEFGARHAT